MNNSQQIVHITHVAHQCFQTPGGYSHVKAYRDVPPKWGTFSPKILRHGSHFGQKNPLMGVPFHRNCEKIVESAIFEAEKP